MEKTKKRVALLCGGLDDVMRGYETHCALLFSKLCGESLPEHEIWLFKGSGQRAPREIVLAIPKRSSRLVRWLARFRGDSCYWEGVFFAARFLLHTLFHRKKFSKVLVIEPMVGRMIKFFKVVLPGAPTLVFTHGVWMEPHEYTKMGDCFHQVNIENFEKMAEYLERHRLHRPSMLIPHFVDDEPQILALTRDHAKRRFGIPFKRTLLCVGILSRGHKNTEYLIHEASQLPDDWGLVLCGPVGESDLIPLAKKILGRRFLHLSLGRDEVGLVYRVADLFALCSPQEGFGIVILEAMRAGLPIVLHRRRLFEWILGDPSCCVDMGCEGQLSQFINDKIDQEASWFMEKGQANRALFESSYTWGANRRDYLNLIASDGTYA